MRRFERTARNLPFYFRDYEEATVRTWISVLGIVASLVAAVSASAQAPTAFVLNVDSEGFFSTTVEGAPLRLNESAVRERALAVLRDDRDATFVVEAAPTAPSQRVTQAAQLLQQAGVSRIGFRTSIADQP
jgi:biopolymer transport protein ExbD